MNQSPVSKPTHTTEGRLQPAHRMLKLEAARYLSALAIVWIHAFGESSWERTTVLGRFAVPFFVTSAVFFLFSSLKRHPTRNFGAYAYTRFQRIYVPYITWCVIYFALWKVRDRIAPNTSVGDFSLWDWLWLGTGYHLWFLPFILVTTMALFPLAKQAALNPKIAVWAAPVFIVLAVGVTLFPFAQSFRMAMGEGWKALPAVFAGAALALAWRGELQRLFATRAIKIFAGLIFVVCNLALLNTGRNVFLENAAGLGLFCALIGGIPSASNDPPQWFQSLAHWGAWSYGVYLSHVVFVVMLRAVFHRVLRIENVGVDILVWLGASIAATLITAWLTRTKFARWLLAT